VKTGIQKNSNHQEGWIPACAGMAENTLLGLFGFEFRIPKSAFGIGKI
jgi:hypothetical protein